MSFVYEQLIIDSGLYDSVCVCICTFFCSYSSPDDCFGDALFNISEKILRICFK